LGPSLARSLCEARDFSENISDMKSSLRVAALLLLPLYLVPADAVGIIIISGGSGSALTVAAASTGAGIGLILIGADPNSTEPSWDCWKPILRDSSVAPSRGRAFAEVLSDPRVLNYDWVDGSTMLLRNVWDEIFRIEIGSLPWGQIAAHATKVPTPRLGHGLSPFSSSAIARQKQDAKVLDWGNVCPCLDGKGEW